MPACLPACLGAGGQIELEIPVGRIATAQEAVGYAGAEAQQSIAAPDGGEGLESEAHIFWSPAPQGPAQELLARLAERGLLLEIFGLEAAPPNLAVREPQPEPKPFVPRPAPGEPSPEQLAEMDALVALLERLATVPPPATR